MKGEINLLPRPMILARERRAYLDGLGRLLQRSSILLIILLIGELAVYGAFQLINREIAAAKINRVLTAGVVSEIVAANAFLGEFERRVDQQVTWSWLVEDALKAAPAGIKISLIEVQEKLPPILRISGISSSQKQVSEYQTRLEGMPWVKKIDAPLQNYALGQTISYSLNLVVGDE